MSLDKIFGLYTIGFLGVTVLIGIGGGASACPNQMDRLDLHGAVARASTSSSASSPGRRMPTSTMSPGGACPPSTTAWPPAPTGCRPPRSSRWRGALSAQGFVGLGYVMGWTGGYLLLAVFLGPYLRQFGAYTIPDFLGARYGGNAARIVGVVGAIACSFTYLIAQVTGVGPHRRPLHRARLQHRRLRRPARRAVLLGARRHALGHLDPGRPVHHPDHFVPGPGRVPVVDDLHASRFPS